MTALNTSVFNTDFLVFMVAVALLIVMLATFTAIAYFTINKALRLNGMPYAIHLKDLQPGQILLDQSNRKGRDVRVVDTMLDRDGFGGGYIVTSDRESLRVSISSLILAI